jgi:hypothetical protein
MPCGWIDLGKRTLALVKEVMVQPAPGPALNSGGGLSRGEDR